MWFWATNKYDIHTYITYAHAHTRLSIASREQKKNRIIHLYARFEIIILFRLLAPHSIGIDVFVTWWFFITVRVLRLVLLLVAKQPMPWSYYTILSWRSSTYVIFAKVNWFSNPYYYYSRERERDGVISFVTSFTTLISTLFIRLNSLSLFQNLISSLFYLRILFVFFFAHTQKMIHTTLTIGYIDWALTHIQLADLIDAILDEMFSLVLYCHTLINPMHNKNRINRMSGFLVGSSSC